MSLDPTDTETVLTRHLHDLATAVEAAFGEATEPAALPARTAPTGRPSRRWLLAVAAVVVVVGAIGALVATALRAPSGNEEASVEGTLDTGLQAFPTETLQDLVTYGDALVVLRVDHVRDLDAEALEDGHLTQPRTVDATVVETLWARPGAPTAPAQVHLLAYGYVIRDGRREPVRGRDLPWWTVGHTYVGVIARMGERWVDLNGNMFEVVDGMVDPTSVTPASWVAQAGRFSPDDYAAMLAATPPDPRSVGLDPTLDPGIRAQRIWASRDTSTSTDPGGGIGTTAPPSSPSTEAPPADVRAVGEIAGAPVVQQWNSYPGGGWTATYGVAVDGPPSVEFSIGLGPDPADPRGSGAADLGDILLPGGHPVDAPGVEVAFAREGGGFTTVTGLRRGMVLALTIRTDSVADLDDAVALYGRVVAAVPAP